MKKIITYPVWIIFIVSFLFLQSSAQDRTASGNFQISIPEIALVSVKSATSLVTQLSPNIPNEAGLPLDFSNTSKSDIWINYSSVVPGNGARLRDLNVKAEGEIPPGISLKIKASGDAGYGAGKKGSPFGELSLTNQYQPLISDIGSCYTGVGTNKGHQITYSLEIDEHEAYSALAEQNVTLTVVFTLSDIN